MNWKVEYLGMHHWSPMAQFLFHIDAEDYITTMVTTRGYSPDKFRIKEVFA